MKDYVIRDQKYQLIENYKDGFDLNMVVDLCTEYFDPYDYIVGDWAYGKLRLKGFCNKDNSLYKKINDIDRLEDYIHDECAFECRYFVLKKING